MDSGYIERASAVDVGAVFNREIKYRAVSRFH